MHAHQVRADDVSPDDTRLRLEDDSPCAELVVPLGLRAPTLARRAVVRCLTGRVGVDVLADVQLLVSELVTNSVRHSGGPDGDAIVVRVGMWRDACRLEVEDHGHGGATVGRQNGDHGLGLDLVDTLSDRWGVVRSNEEGTTRVWLQLSSGAVL